MAQPKRVKSGEITPLEKQFFLNQVPRLMQEHNITGRRALWVKQFQKRFKAERLGPGDEPEDALGSITFKGEERDPLELFVRGFDFKGAFEGVNPQEGVTQRATSTRRSRPRTRFL